MTQKIEDFIENLSSEELDKLQNEAEEKFYIDNIDNIYDIHDKIQKYCSYNLLDIYNGNQGYNDIYNFTIDQSSLIHDIFNKNIREEIKLIEIEDSDLSYEHIK